MLDQLNDKSFHARIRVRGNKNDCMQDSGLCGNIKAGNIAQNNLAEWVVLQLRQDQREAEKAADYTEAAGEKAQGAQNNYGQYKVMRRWEKAGEEMPDNLHRRKGNEKARGTKMPYITVESGVLSDEQKEELIRRLTEVSSEIMKVPQEFFVTTIKELPDQNFGIGGKTIDKVKAEYRKKHS